MEDLCFGISIAIAVVYYLRDGRWGLFLSATEGKYQITGSNAHGTQSTSTGASSGSSSGSSASSGSSGSSGPSGAPGNPSNGQTYTDPSGNSWAYINGSWQAIQVIGN